MKTWRELRRIARSMAIEAIDATTFDTNGPEMHDALDDLDPGEVSLVRNEFGRFKARALKAIRAPSPSTPNTKE